MKGRKGFSLIEVTIILVVLSILAAIMAPVIGRYVRNAKVVRAREDVQALGSAIWMFIEDTGNSYFLQDGNGDGSASPLTGRPDQGSSNRVEMLVSDGDIPEVGPDVTAIGAWRQSVNLGSYDFFSNHLVTNTPGGDSGNAYRTPTDLTNDATDDPMFEHDSSGGFNSEFAWRGPYITPPIDPDPWGNRYASNVGYLDAVADSGDSTAATTNGFKEDCIVLCAGPDEEIDTSYNVDGNAPGDDDIIYTVSGNSRP